MMPLSDFPAAMREEIERAIECKKPPPRYKQFGVADFPRPLAQIPSRAWYEWHLARGHKFDDDRELIDTTSSERKEWHRVSRRLRPVVLERDGYICQQCGADGALVALHIDHITPLARGGSNELDNLQVLCQPCNSRKWAH